MIEYNAQCFELSAFVRCIILEKVVIQAMKRNVIAEEIIESTKIKENEHNTK